MEDNQKEGGAPTGEGGVQSQAKETEQEKLVKYQDHERALKDLHKFKSTAKEYEAKINDYEARLKAIEEDKMAAEGKKDELIERYKSQISELESKNQQVVDSFFSTQKYNAVASACKKLGLSDAAEDDLGLLTLDGVEVERTDQGRVLVHNAEQFAQELKKKKPHWFANNSAPKLNTGGARKEPEPSELTAAYMYKLEKTDKAKFYELMPKYIEQKRNA